MSRLAVLLLVIAAGTFALAEAADTERGGREPMPAVPGRERVDPARAVERVVQLTNSFRQHEGRGAVSPNRDLAAAAQEFAAFMARTNRFGHEVDGSRPEQRAERHGYAYRVIAENIAYQYRSAGFSSDELADVVVGDWKHSPEHRRNLLDPEVTDVGVGIARSSTNGRWYAVQVLGRPQS